MHFELTREFIDNLKIIIEKKDENNAKLLIKELHAADIAEIYDELEDDEVKFLSQILDGETSADVLAELEDEERERFLENVSSEILANKFIHHMDTDDAADVLADLEDEKKDEVLSLMQDVEHAGDIVDLLNYEEDTAGGLMAKEYVQVNENWTVSTCIEEIRKQAEDVSEIYYVYVIDDDEKFKGIVSLKKLILATPDTIVEKIYHRDSKFVKVDTDNEEVANIMDKYGLVSLPVVDAIGRLVGKISIDDVVDLLREEAEKDYQMASGISHDVEPSDNVWLLTKARVPWLLIGLAGGIFSSRVVGVFEGDLIKYATLALFIPLIGAMGGNVGVQSSAIIVQGLAAKTIGFESVGRRIFKELSVAMLNAVICSVLLFCYNLLFSDSFALTISVSLSLFIVIIFASTFGTFVPLALNKLKIDPALATGPFITTVNDIMGLAIYLLISRNLFQYMDF